VSVPHMKAFPYYFRPERMSARPQELRADICIYGGTSAGVVAAVAAARRGKRVVLLNPGDRIGGMTTGGLSYTDLGNAAAIGGMSRAFYREAGQRYGVSECWTIEPSVALQIFEAWIKDADVSVYGGAFLKAVECSFGRIRAVRLIDGLRVEAAFFIDASYEGDLMALAGVSHVIGRESNSAYGEQLNGAQLHSTHQFDCLVDPYVCEGAPGSGLLPGIDPDPPAPSGTADRRIQAYCFRVCMTRSASNRLEFPKPRDYDASLYRLAERWLRATSTDVFAKFDLICGGKTDTNNHGAVSTDFIGANHRWPEADYGEREKIFQRHVSYQQGLHWFMANDPCVPAPIRDRYREWGLSRDEFEETGHWPPQLYIREARRMVGDKVHTELDCREPLPCDEPVGMGAYQMDSHNCRRCVLDGAVVNEGDVQVPLLRPYPISYRIIVPARGDRANLLVPVCVSASHIAFGSIRMEPVFMILAESAAIAACVAMDEGCSVQDVPYESLRQELAAAGQILGCESANSGDGNPSAADSVHR
jgi:hypothetical protein